MASKDNEKVTKSRVSAEAPKVGRRKRFTNEEKELVVEFVSEFNKAELWALIDRSDLTEEVRKQATRAELRNYVLGGLDSKAITYEDLVDFLDEIQPWSRQHAYLYDGPAAAVVKQWRTRDHVAEVLGKYGLAHLLDESIPLILPPTLTISSIEYDEGKRLRVTAIRRRDWSVRDKDRDEEEKIDGEVVEYRAYVRTTVRGLVIFDWNLKSNTASLHITQQGEAYYDEIEKEFFDLTSAWLNRDWFSKLQLARSITNMHVEEETAAKKGTSRRFRSHGISYDIQNRRLHGSCGVVGEPLIVNGVDVISESLTRAREEGIGHQGNYYWYWNLRKDENGDDVWDRELHFVVWGADLRRVVFPTDHNEEVITNVLARVREACKA